VAARIPISPSFVDEIEQVAYQSPIDFNDGYYHIEKSLAFHVNHGEIFSITTVVEIFVFFDVETWVHLKTKNQSNLHQNEKNLHGYLIQYY